MEPRIIRCSSHWLLEKLDQKPLSPLQKRRYAAIGLVSDGPVAVHSNRAALERGSARRQLDDIANDGAGPGT